MEDIIQTWHIHNRINGYLLDAIEEAWLHDISASKGRAVGAQFAHIHQVRLMWLKASAPELLDGQVAVSKDQEITKALLTRELNNSAEGIASLLVKGFREGKIKNFKPHPTAFFGYLISHESHHRGQIVVTLKAHKHPIDKKTQFGLWEWGTR